MENDALNQLPVDPEAVKVATTQTLTRWNMLRGELEDKDARPIEVALLELMDLLEDSPEIDILLGHYHHQEYELIDLKTLGFMNDFVSFHNKYL